MKDIFSDFFKISISTSIIFLIFGLLLFFNPDGVIVAISVIIGVLAIIFGISEFIVYFKNKDINSGNLIVGIFSLLSGIMLVINTSIIATIIPVIIGACMIGLGARKLQIALTFKEEKLNGWLYVLIMSIVTLIVGIILIINPIGSATLATKIIGAIIMIYSIADIIDSCIIKKNVKDVVKIIEEK